MGKNTPRTVRVATNNNFNCTKKEYAQLKGITSEYPQDYFFTNTNIFSPKITNMNDQPYKAVITLNPDLDFGDKAFSILKTLDKNRIGFLRVKYTPNMSGFGSVLGWLAAEGYKVVVTLQRFNGIESISKYVPNFREHYKHSYNRYRLFGKSLEVIEDLVDSHNDTYICDRSGKGCQDCGLCSKLTLGEDRLIYSLNLSSSGLCKFNCPDCYAKTMQRFCVQTGHRPMIFDKIRRNLKQKGDLKHIQSKFAA